jgi:hypothetical protein
MTNADTLRAASQFDQLPDDAIVTTATAAVILGGTLTEQTLRRNPPIKRRQVSQRRYGFRVGDLRKLIRGEIAPAAA